MSEEDILMMVKKSEASIPRRRPKKIVIPRRVPSVVIPDKRPIFITPDKTTCVECICYPKEEPYVRNKCDILRWMKIIMPESIKMDHWDLVWYQKPDFPNVKFARIGKRPPYVTIPIPHYEKKPEDHKEYLVPRRFKFQENIPESEQYIWMENVITPKEEEKKAKEIVRLKKESRLVPKKINLTGLKGKEFVLAKRKTPKPKFLP